MEALSKEREAYAKLESEFKDMQAKYFDIKEAIEGREEQVIRAFQPRGSPIINRFLLY